MKISSCKTRYFLLGSIIILSQMTWKWTLSMNPSQKRKIELCISSQFYNDIETTTKQAKKKQLYFMKIFLSTISSGLGWAWSRSPKLSWTRRTKLFSLDERIYFIEEPSLYFLDELTRVQTADTALYILLLSAKLKILSKS